MPKFNSSIKANQIAGLNPSENYQGANTENNNCQKDTNIEKTKPNSQPEKPSSEKSRIQSQSKGKSISEKLIDDAMLKGF